MIVHTFELLTYKNVYEVSTAAFIMAELAAADSIESQLIQTPWKFNATVSFVLINFEQF